MATRSDSGRARRGYWRPCRRAPAMHRRRAGASGGDPPAGGRAQATAASGGPVGWTAMLDPQQRWRAYGEKPDYMGPLSFGGAPLTQDPAELVSFDIAIVGAPMDELVSDKPGTRYAPRAIRAASCPPGPHLEAKIDAFAELEVVDYGDAPVV